MDALPPPQINLDKSHSVQSRQINASSKHKVVTKPPWAKNEPPSPTDSDHDQHSSSPSTSGSSEARRADIDYTPRGPPDGEHRWFPFTRHLPLLPPSELFTGATGESSPTRVEKRPAIFRTPSSLREAYTAALSEKNAESGPSRKPGLRITMPTPPSTPYTLSRTRTPGWDSPWAPKPLESLLPLSISEQLRNGRSSEKQDDSIIIESWWPRTRKRARAYLLNNTYVPLLFRFVNITFTAAALAIATRIQRVEKRYNAVGVLGISPMLVVIFAPLTLVHVMIAIYLEYFGRPLGLWRTSAKLAHTLLEVLYICAWSAALSLCFDNFFTSSIPCATRNAALPRPSSPFEGDLKKAGQSLCGDQVALICLVGIGLVVNCFSLVISLYRIFEKVKYHPTSAWEGSFMRA